MFFRTLQSFQLGAASLHHRLDAPPGKSRNLLFGRCFQHLIVLIPNENTMSQFVDKYRRRGAGTKVACPGVIAPGGPVFTAGCVRSPARHFRPPGWRRTPRRRGTPVSIARSAVPGPEEA